MAKQVCIWLRAEQKVQQFGKPESTATYEEMFSQGWTPKMEGEITVVFEREISENDSR